MNILVTPKPDQSPHVRQVSAMALGILRAGEAREDLEYVAENDNNTMVRSQAVVSLGQIGSKQSLGLLIPGLFGETGLQLSKHWK